MLEVKESGAIAQLLVQKMEVSLQGINVIKGSLNENVTLILALSDMHIHLLTFYYLKQFIYFVTP